MAPKKHFTESDAELNAGDTDKWNLKYIENMSPQNSKSIQSYVHNISEFLRYTNWCTPGFLESCEL